MMIHDACTFEVKQLEDGTTQVTGRFQYFGVQVLDTQGGPLPTIEEIERSKRDCETLIEIGLREMLNV